MRQSQYVQPYLAKTANPKTRYTPGTYLAYTLRGAAKHQYGSDYKRALVNSLMRLVADGTVISTRSMHGYTAFIYVDQEVK
jgi:NADH:ubiquinone oxidoreductase subunit F (NADH-binding)